MKFLVFCGALAVFLAIGEAENERCGSTKECGANECCLSRGIFSFRKGDCKRFARKGKTCSEEDDLSFVNKYDYYCPCEAGLSCEPTRVKNLLFATPLAYDHKCVEDEEQTTPIEPETETEPEPEPETEPEPEPETEPEPEPETEEPSEE
ncbi:uncharacterized protein CEXT_164401 [Caerostris extrusa]|uniref:Prokineticin domain-containing protein n=1 Tax=Caerostris extrusa TaxID=172846 RepID=A0AAV4PSE2_CAEEX|nr:uncharacterized protein CEXT_164401 [Caerostris extrusa]